MRSPQKTLRITSGFCSYLIPVWQKILLLSVQAVPRLHPATSNATLPGSALGLAQAGKQLTTGSKAS